VSGNFDEDSYTIFVKPEQIQDLARFDHDLNTRKVKSTVNDGVTQVKGDSANLVAILVNQGLSAAEAEKELHGEAQTNFRNDRDGHELEVSNQRSRRTSRAGHSSRKKPVFGITEDNIDGRYFIQFKAAETHDENGVILPVSKIEGAIAAHNLDYDVDGKTFTVHGDGTEIKALFKDLGLDNDVEIYSDDARENFRKDRERAGVVYDLEDEEAKRTRRQSRAGHSSRKKPAFGLSEEEKKELEKSKK
jgi:hypothetical protein